MQRFASSLALGAGVWLAALPVRADSASVPADQQIQIIFAALDRDRKLERVGSQLTMGVVYVASDPGSAAMAGEMMSKLLGYQDKTVKRLPLKFLKVPYSTTEELERTIRAKEIDLLYLAPGLNGQIGEIVQLAGRLGKMTVTGVAEYVKKGVAFGVGKFQNNPRLYVNLSAAKAQGSEFEAGLLRLADKI